MAEGQKDFSSLIKQTVGNFIRKFADGAYTEVQTFVELAARVFPRYLNLVAAGKSAEDAFCEAAELEFRSKKEPKRPHPKAAHKVKIETE